MRFRYRKSKWLKQPSVRKATVAKVINGTARLDLESTSGPPRACASRSSGRWAISASSSGLIGSPHGADEVERFVLRILEGGPV